MLLRVYDLYCLRFAYPLCYWCCSCAWVYNNHCDCDSKAQDKQSRYFTIVSVTRTVPQSVHYRHTVVKLQSNKKSIQKFYVTSYRDSRTAKSSQGKKIWIVAQNSSVYNLNQPGLRAIFGCYFTTKQFLVGYKEASAVYRFSLSGRLGRKLSAKTGKSAKKLMWAATGITQPVRSTGQQMLISSHLRGEPTISQMVGMPDV